MTENEAIANLTHRRDCWIGLKYVNNNPEPWVSGVLEEAMQKGAEALEEIQQYRAIGTVEGYERAIETSKENYNLYREYKDLLREYEAIGTIEEFKALKEKNEPKKARWHGHHFCPNCNSIVYVNGGKDIYCPKCGQKLDWSK